MHLQNIIYCHNHIVRWCSELLSSICCFFFSFQSFTGNEDRNSEIKHILYEGVFARYLQFLPETQQGAVCLRTELFGVKLKPGEYRFIIIFKNTTTLFSFRNMFWCFKHHHQPLWIYSKDLQKWSVYITVKWFTT